MNLETWGAVDAYLTSHLHDPDPVQEMTLERCAEAGLPEIQVSAAQGKLLYLLARLCGAERILELGTLGGYSTIWLARALPERGRLITLELDPACAQVARANLARAGVESKVDVVEGAALDTLRRLETEGAGPFDLVFIDADKESYADYLPLVLGLSRPGTVIVADNVVRNGSVIDPNDSDARVKGVRRFLDRMTAEPGVEATAIQTVGAKGYDGFLIGRVK